MRLDGDASIVVQLRILTLAHQCCARRCACSRPHITVESIRSIEIRIQMSAAVLLNRRTLDVVTASSGRHAVSFRHQGIGLSG